MRPPSCSWSWRVILPQTWAVSLVQRAHVAAEASPHDRALVRHAACVTRLPHEVCLGVKACAVGAFCNVFQSTMSCICMYSTYTSILEHCTVRSKRNHCRGKHIVGTAGEGTLADDSTPPSLQFDEARNNKRGQLRISPRNI